MGSFKRYSLKYGLPQSVYLDCHSTYNGSKKQTLEDELLNRQALSQFGSALDELAVHLIHAQSAPAKGRIERLFKTFQDRLIKEMRLRGIKNIAEGNRFLLRNDFTVAHEGRLYQVEDNIRSKEVIVEERINGSLFITYKGRALHYKQIAVRPKRVEEKAKKLSAAMKKEPYVVPWNHPWKRFRLPGSHPIKTQEEVFAGTL